MKKHKKGKNLRKDDPSCVSDKSETDEGSLEDVLVVTKAPFLQKSRSLSYGKNSKGPFESASNDSFLSALSHDEDSSLPKRKVNQSSSPDSIESLPKESVVGSSLTSFKHFGRAQSDPILDNLSKKECLFEPVVRQTGPCQPGSFNALPLVLEDVKSDTSSAISTNRLLSDESTPENPNVTGTQETVFFSPQPLEVFSSCGRNVSSPKEDACIQIVKNSDTNFSLSENFDGTCIKKLNAEILNPPNIESNSPGCPNSIENFAKRDCFSNSKELSVTSTANNELDEESQQQTDVDLSQINSLGSPQDTAEMIVNEVLQNALAEIDEPYSGVLQNECANLLELSATLDGIQTNLKSWLNVNKTATHDEFQTFLENSATALLRVQVVTDCFLNKIENDYSKAYTDLIKVHASEMESERIEAEERRTVLETELTDVKAQLVATRAQLAAREDIEKEMAAKILRLEEELLEKERSCQEELKDIISQHLQKEIIWKATHEVEKEEEIKKKKGSEEEKVEELGPSEIREMKLMQLLTACEQKINYLEQINDELTRKQCLTRHCSCNGAFNEGMVNSVLETNEQFSSPVVSTKDLQSENMHYEVREKLIECVTNNDGKSDEVEAEKSSSADDKLVKKRKSRFQPKPDEIKSAIPVAVLKVTDTRNSLSKKRKIDNQESAVGKITEENVSYNDRVFVDPSCSAVTSYELDNNNEINAEQTASPCDLLSANFENRMRSEENLVLNQENINESIRVVQLETVSVGVLENVDNISESAAEISDSKDTIRIDQVESLRQTLLEKESKIAELTSEVNNLKSYVAEAKPSIKSEGEDNAVNVIELLQKYKAAVVKLTIESEALQEKCRVVTNDLHTCLSERCQVEDELSSALKENEILYTRVQKLERSLKRMASVVKGDLPESDTQIKLQQMVKQIVSDLLALDPRSEINKDADGNLYSDNDLEASLLSSQQSSGELSFRLHCEEDVYHTDKAGERLEPEGGFLPLQTELSSRMQEITHQQTQTDQNAEGSPHDVVETLIKYLDAYEGELNGSIGDKLHLTADNSSFLDTTAEVREEMSRYLSQLKEEAAQIYALSTNREVQRLQEEIRSFEAQIAASDKKIKSAMVFMEEQAIEREAERDEFSQRLAELREIVKVKERQASALTKLQQHVETVETQLQETTAALDNCRQERNDVDKKHDEAVKKIWSMRDIISSLEVQLAEKSEELAGIEQQNLQLKDKLVRFGQMSDELETAQRSSQTDLLEYVEKLETELMNLRLKLEHSCPESLVTVRDVIRELEMSVCRRTRELELVTVVGNNISSTSEEISNRHDFDATRAPTPDEMAIEQNFNLEDEIDRLRERLQKHGRAEEAALRRMRELEVQGNKFDDVQSELDVACQKLESYLSENAALKARLEEQRTQAVEKELIKSLREKLQILQNEFEVLQDDCRTKEQLLMEMRRRQEQLLDSVSAHESNSSQALDKQTEVCEELKIEKMRADKATDEVNKLTLRNASLSAQLESLNSRVERLQQEVVSASSASHESSTSNKFATPDSFIGSSITTISKLNESIMRDISASNNNWSVGVPRDSKELCDLESSISVLHLSPRGLKPKGITMNNSCSLLVEASVQTDLISVEPEQRAATITPEEKGNHHNASREDIFPNRIATSSKSRSEDLPEVLRDDSDDEMSNYAVKKRDQRLSPPLPSITEICEVCKKCLEGSPVKDDKSNKLAQLQSEMDIMAKDLEGLSNIKQEYDEKIKLNNELTLKVSELSKELSLLKETPSVIETNEELKNILRRNEKEFERLQNEFYSKTKQLEEEKLAAENAIIDLRSLNTITETCLAEQRSESLALLSNLNAVVLELNNLKESHSDEEINRLKAQLHDTQEKNKAIIAALNERLEKDKELIDMEKEKLSRVLCDMEEYAKDRREIESEVRETRVEVELLRGKIIQEEDDRKRLLHELCVCQRQLSDSNQNLALQSQKCLEQSMKIDEAETHVQRLTKQIGEEEEKRYLVSEELQRHSTILRKAQENASDLSRSNKMLETMIVTLRHQLLNEQEKVNQLEKELETTKGSLCSESAVQLSQLRGQNVLLQKLATTLEQRLEEQRTRFEEDADLMEQLQQTLEEKIEKLAVFQTELALEKRRSNDQAIEMRRLQLQIAHLQGGNSSTRAMEQALKCQLTVAEEELIKLKHIVDVQNVQIKSLSALQLHDRVLHNIEDMGGAQVRGIGERAESQRDWRWSALRAESYRKALIWQKQYLTKCFPPPPSRRRPRTTQTRSHRSFRCVAWVIIATHRMKFMVKKWRSNLPILITGGTERRMVLTSPPTRDVQLPRLVL